MQRNKLHVHKYGSLSNGQSDEQLTVSVSNDNGVNWISKEGLLLDRLVKVQQWLLDVGVGHVDHGCSGVGDVVVVCYGQVEHFLSATISH